MARIFCILIFLLFSSNVFAVKVLTISDSCIRLNDLYPGLSARDIVCNLNFGDERRISKERIKNILSIEGVNPENSVIESFRVTRYGKIVTDTDLKVRIFTILKAKYPAHRIEIIKFKKHNDIFTDAEGFLDISIAGSNFGSLYVNVSNGIKNYRVYLYAKAYLPVYITTDKVKKGELFFSNIEKKEMDVTSIRHRIIQNPKEYIARRNIPSNKIITSNYVVPKPINFAGDHVSLIYKTKTISIATAGVLEENAYIGKRVQVKNIKSGQIIHAKVGSKDKFYVVF